MTDELPLKMDLQRRQRCGYPEAVFAEGKSSAVVLEAFHQLYRNGDHCLATRVTPEQAAVVQQTYPTACYHTSGRTLRLMQPVSDCPVSSAIVYVVTAGTTDANVADEAAETLRWMGYEPRLIYDIGVAGPQRLLQRVPELQTADVLIVTAGMEGALSSVVAGWVACPVIAVPTSVGYGANFGGLAALLSMLNSCAANVCVVNIDAGFKAGFLAGLMLKKQSARPSDTL